jgi:hypothetical protein
MTHTPGPWFVNGPYDHTNDLFIRATVDGENFDVASTYDDETGNAQANAKLIAAAPELLDALILANETMNEHFGITDEDDAGNHAHDQIREAIKKATKS